MDDIASIKAVVDKVNGHPSKWILSLKALFVSIEAFVFGKKRRVNVDDPT